MLDLGLDELRARELQPFAAMVKGGAEIVMTAHILFPQIDGDVPATMSKPLLTGVLREELGFEGLILTDDLGMHAVSKRFEQPGAVAAAVNAGTDLLMLCAHWADTGRLLGMAEELARAADAGDIPSELLSASKARIRSALDRVPQHGIEVLPLERFEAHQQLGPLRPRVGTATDLLGQIASPTEG